MTTLGFFAGVCAVAAPSPNAIGNTSAVVIRNVLNMTLPHKTWKLCRVARAPYRKIRAGTMSGSMTLSGRDFAGFDLKFRMTVVGQSRQLAAERPGEASSIARDNREFHDAGSHDGAMTEWNLRSPKNAVFGDGTNSDSVRYSPLPPLPFSASSPMCSTDTTCSSSAVSNTMTPWVERPAIRIPATGQRISWPLSVTSMIWSESSTGNDATSLPLRPFTDIATIPLPPRPVVRYSNDDERLPKPFSLMVSTNCSLADIAT